VGLKDRIRRLERNAQGQLTTVACPVCGEVVRSAEDLALELLAAAWAREVGKEVDESPAVASILEHPHDALRLEILRDLPGVARAG
jgi:hypothetical protein